MNKFFSVAKISLSQEFSYRASFVMWRVRNIFQIFLIFFLWDSIFSTPGREVFGYDRAKILTYIFALVIVRGLVLSNKATEVAGEIARSDLTISLFKPISYFKYWFSRDMASKALNSFFAFFEILILFILLRPEFYFQSDLTILLMFLLSLALAIVCYFFLILFFSMFTFWLPEQAWGLIFLLLIFVDLLGGGVFPLDILPSSLRSLVYWTPFPYLLFAPIQIYLGKLSLMDSLGSITASLIWVFILYFSIKKLWKLGLRQYAAPGR